MKSAATIVSARVEGGKIIVSLKCAECQETFEYKIYGDQLAKLCSKKCREVHSVRNRPQYGSAKISFTCSRCGYAFMAYKGENRRKDGKVFCPSCRLAMRTESEEMNREIYRLKTEGETTFKDLGKMFGKTAQAVKTRYDKVVRKEKRRRHAEEMRIQREAQLAAKVGA